MARKTDAYVDTAAFIAFADKSDSYHSLFRRLFSDPPPLLTTPLVIAEGHGWFRKRYDRSRALHFVALIRELTPLRIVSVGPAEYEGGVAVLRRFSDQDLSVVDAVGLHMMRTLKVRTCWSTDFHMRLTGVPLVVDEY